MKEKRTFYRACFVAFALALTAGFFLFRQEKASIPSSPAYQPPKPSLAAGKPGPERGESYSAQRSVPVTSPSPTTEPIPQSNFRSQEESFAAFENWVGRFQQATGPQEREALLAEGVLLAAQRRAAMFSLIQTDPARAIELAAPSAWHGRLPSEVTGLLEERLSGRGDYAVLGVYPLPGQESEVVPIQRTVTLDGVERRAFVYGARAEHPTKNNIPLHGVALADVMALSDNPVRRLDRDARARLIAAAAREAICSVSGLTATVVNEPTPVDVGGEIIWLCRDKHAEELKEQLLAAAGDPGSSPDGTPAESPYTEGRKRIIMMRIAFSDLPTPDVTSNSLVTVHAAINVFWRVNSYGRTTLAPLGAGSDIVQINLAGTAAQYNDDAGALRTDVRAAATAQGIDLGRYDFDVIYTGGGRPSFSFGGLGYVGAPGSWVVGASTTITAHELGHNLGFPHANYWDTGGQSAIGTGGNQEYGDPFDVMGGGSASGVAAGHYVSKFKWRIGWLLDEDFPHISTNGLFRIHAHDNIDTRGLCGVRFAGTGGLDYFLEFRQLFTANAALMNGIGLRWGTTSGSSSQLIDTTPGTTDGKNDSAIVIGRTFSDPAAGVHITPVGLGRTYPPSIDVQVNFGSFPSNRAPTLIVSATTTATGIGASVNFAAVATDLDGNALAYYWEFGDGSYSTNNSAVVTKSWTSAGEYVVRCVASDMRGGSASDSVIVRVGSPTTFTISGRALSQSRPLANVLVRAGGRSAYTDSDGTYTLTGLGAGSHTVSAQLYPNTLINPFFSNPVTVGPNATGIDFLAVTAPQNDAAVITNLSVWKYLDDGSDQGTAWTAPGFNDAAWASGRGQLGYGDGDEGTVIRFGADANNKHITYYFRRTFNVPDTALLTNYNLSILRDDGAIVYLNGVEILRDNLPAGPVTFTTVAVDNSEDTTVANIDPALIQSGDNTLAVEVHQVTPSSSDLSFDLQLRATSVTNFANLAAFYIAKPAADEVFQQPADILIQAGAYSDMTYSLVEFYAQGTKLGDDTAAPFEFNWSGAALGTHTLIAVATFSDNSRLTSAPVSITVAAPLLNETLIAADANWDYNDANVSLGSAWSALAYVPVDWSNGPAVLGFGDAGLATTIRSGDVNNRIPTYYFRHSFSLVDADRITNLLAKVYRDDGAVLYLNGSEVARINIGAGPVLFNSLASSGIDGSNETTPAIVSLPANLLRDGVNVLAAELHQSALTSSDARFGLELIGTVSGATTPGVRITSPIAGSTFSVPGVLTIAATAVPTEGETVARIEFYADTTLLGETTTAPHDFSWTQPPAGNWSLTVLAHESGGTIRTSAPVSVQVVAPASGTQLISTRALWRYFDRGSEPDPTWRQRTYDDSDWSQGYGRLGYGGDGEFTVVSFGPDGSKRYPATYFRHAFVLNSVAGVNGLKLGLTRDDGAVVYLNGLEIYRNNMHVGVVNFNSLALAGVEAPDETALLQVTLSTAGLVVGTNVIAVEVHQQNVASGDLGFDLALIAESSTNFTQGVYVTSPASGAHVTLPATVTITAFAHSTAEAITGVDFLVDGSLVGMDASAPYSVSWSGAVVGSHAITAIAQLAGGGGMTSAPVNVVVDGPPIMVSAIMTTFLPAGSSWKYWSNGVTPSVDWKLRSYDDAAWPQGNARFGWGLDGEVTTLPSVHVTHYFRRWIAVSNPALYQNLILQLQRDDGAIVYLNGLEVFRSAMPDGPATSSTLATITANGLDEQQFYIAVLPITGLVSGTNLLSVELHQSSANSSDGGFDLHLAGSGSTAPRVVLTSPPDATAFGASTAIDMEAAAWAGTGRAVAKVEFFADGIEIGEDDSTPYTVTWLGATVTNHVLAARLTDNFGEVLMSAPVHISVGNVMVATNFVTTGSVWKFLDNGSNQGTNWAQRSFNDGSWVSGPAQLGYGDNDEATVVSFGPNGNSKFITTYFRRWFNVPEGYDITNLVFRLLRDDGAVVWINGREAYRHNMPGGVITSATLASAVVNDANESTFFVTNFGNPNLIAGTNLIAVEIHQSALNSSDISFDLDLAGSGIFVPVPAPSLALQKLPNGQMRIAWTASPEWILYQSPTPAAGPTWVPVGTPPTVVSGRSFVILPPSTESTFYRLQR